MKKIFFVTALCICWFYSNAQLEISIHLKTDNQVDITVINDGEIIEIDHSTELNSKGNKISIVNDNNNDDCRILLRSQSGGSTSYTLDFGKPGSIKFPNGKVEHEFNKGDKLNWAGNQIFSLPCLIIVMDKSKKPIGGRTINAVTNSKSDSSTYGKSNIKKVFTGIPYYDALSLASCRKITLKDFLEILNFYNGGTQIVIPSDLLEQFKSNTYIYEVLQRKIQDECYIIDKESFNGFDFQKTISSVGGLDVTNIADGFAKFIVKRTKQELSIAFFEKFKDELDNVPDIQSIFPQTHRALDAIGNEIYNFEAYIQTLRECFEKDLASLPSNLPAIIENNKAYFGGMPDLKSMLLSGFYISQSFQDKQHPGNIIENFEIENLNNLSNPNIKPSFQTLKLISTSLKSNKDEESYWVSESEIKELVSSDNEILLKIFLGLLEQKAKLENIVFGKNDSLWKIIDNSYSTSNFGLPKYRLYIKNISSKVRLLENKIVGFKKVSDDSLRFENYYSVASNSIELMKYLSQVENLPFFPQGLNIKNSTKPYFDIAQTATDVVIDVSRRNYSSAIVNGVYLYDLTFSIENLNKYLNEKSITENRNDIIIKYNNVSKSIFKYGSFMAIVAQAKSSDDVEAAIEAFALPTGSARIKRETNFNVALNAYCGLFIGQEEEKFSRINGKAFNSYGVTAPIGLSVSWGHSIFPFTHSEKCGSSSTLFLSIIDLGAITSFRFVNDSTKTLSKIELKDIISPGIFLSWGIPKSPISVNLGYQITPYLREVKSTDNSFKSSFSRFSVSIVVDLPLLNFYTKSR